MERAARSRRTSLAFVLVSTAMGCRSGGSGGTAQDAAIDRAPEVVQDLAQEPRAEAPEIATPPVDSQPPVVDAAADAPALDLAIDVAAEAGREAAAPVDSSPATSCEAGACLAVRKVVAGGGSTCVIFTDGRIKCWGANVYGLLGLGDEISRGDNPNEMGKNLPFVDTGSGRTVVDLALGGGHACALLDRGQVKCWGGNTFGQLGLGDTLPRGSYPNQMGDNLPVVDLGAGLVVVALAAGRYHTCAIFSDGQVKCWGDNLDNKLGVSSTTIAYSLGGKPGEMGDKLPFVNLGAGRTALGIAVGVGHTCALLDTHQIKCWGGDTWGGLGRGDTPGGTGLVDLGAGRSAVAVSAGHGHTCALLDSGQVKCWGRNEFGELGLGDLVNRGARSVEMGDNLPNVDLGTGRSVREINALDGDSCAVLDNDAVKCWGLNDYGELGVGNTTRYGTAPGQMGDNLPAADPGATAALRVLTAHDDHNCALYADGRLVCWGLNSGGQLGLGDTANRGDSPNEIGLGMPAIDVGM
jgi:E3 ubiquitin-protein ligase HERC3